MLELATGMNELNKTNLKLFDKQDSEYLIINKDNDSLNLEDLVEEINTNEDTDDNEDNTENSAYYNISE